MEIKDNNRDASTVIADWFLVIKQLLLHNISYLNIVDILCRYRDDVFNRVLAPEGEILSFASPKESTQRKGDPDAAYFLRSVVFTGRCQKGLLSLWQRAASLPRPSRAIPNKNASARRGIRECKPPVALPLLSTNQVIPNFFSR